MLIMHKSMSFQWFLFRYSIGYFLNKWDLNSLLFFRMTLLYWKNFGAAGDDFRIAERCQVLSAGAILITIYWKNK